MEDASTNSDRVTIISTNNVAYLLEGEDHLDALLGVNGEYPLPVCYMEFASAFEISVELGRPVPLGDLWQINTAVIDALRRRGELDQTYPPPQD